MQGVWLLLLHFLLLFLLLPSFLEGGVAIGEGLLESPPVYPICLVGWIFFSSLTSFTLPSFCPSQEPPFPYPSM